MSQIKKLKINAPLRGIKAGTIITIRTDRKEIPLDLYWRRRLADSAIDGCVEIVKDDKPERAIPKKVAETKKKGE